VLDYKMIGMDGMAVMKALRAKPETRHLPVLMLTAMTDEQSTRAGFEAGVTDYVTKPFSIPQLTARVRAWLTRTQSTQTCAGLLVDNLDPIQVSGQFADPLA
jgi:two-component system, OmpR family, phosphate regulon response regulator PhoB